MPISLLSTAINYTDCHFSLLVLLHRRTDVSDTDVFVGLFLECEGAVRCHSRIMNSLFIWHYCLWSHSWVSPSAETRVDSVYRLFVRASADSIWQDYISYVGCTSAVDAASTVRLYRIFVCVIIQNRWSKTFDRSFAIRFGLLLFGRFGMHETAVAGKQQRPSTFRRE